MRTRKARSIGASIDASLTFALTAALTSVLPSRIMAAPAHADGTLACAVCHQEHQGTDFDLTEITNARCQSCHQVKFTSFADGHPPFNSYPYARSTRIVFDHSRHISKHFPKAEREGAVPPTSCNHCHKPDGLGQTMQVKAFETSCAGCHTGDIDGSKSSGPNGVPVLEIPGLDRETLAGEGFEVGHWPEDAEAEISPFLRLMVSVEADADLEIAARLDLIDLADATREELAAVQRVAWAIKSLVHEYRAVGPTVLAQRLDERLGPGLDLVTLGRLGAAVPRDVVTSLEAAWFPGVSRELRLFRQGQPLAPAPPGEVETAPAPDATGGRQAGSGDPPEDGDELLEEERDLPAAGSEELLTSDDLTITAMPPDDDDALIEIPLAPSDDDPGEAGAETMPSPDVPPDVWARYGGWFRDAHTLFYRPLVHADPFMHAWLDVLGAAGSGPHAGTALAAFDALSSTELPSKCLKCHSVDAGTNGALKVQWHPGAPHRTTRISRTSLTAPTSA